VKRFACQDIIPGCQHVFTGADDQSVLDQVIAHAAADHGLVKPPLALVELVVATTHTVPEVRKRAHLRLVADEPVAAADEPSPLGDHPQSVTIDPDASQSAADVALSDRRPTAGVVRLATNRFARGNSVAAATADSQANGWPFSVHAGYRHECVMYRGTSGFVSALVPFVRDGLALDQPVMVAVAQPRLQALRDALGEDADRVRFVDMAILGHNPALIIPAWREFVDGAAGRPTRGVGEPIWAGRRDAEVAEGQFHEALLNIALDPATPLWLLCPYDVAALEGAVIDEARRSHAEVVECDEPDGPAPTDTTYAGGGHAMTMFGARLAEPTGPTSALIGRFGRYDDVAAGVLSYAASAGLSAGRSAKLAAAVIELATASSSRTDAEVSVRLWRDGPDLVCDVDDAGVIDDPMVGRSATVVGQPREREIRLANELCDLVQVRSGATGTTVRLHSWL
jgi:predicted small metal-binding protein